MKYKQLTGWIINELEDANIWEDDEHVIPKEEHEDLWRWACALYSGEVELFFEVIECTPQTTTFDDHSPAVFDFELRHEGYLKDKWNAEEMLEKLQEFFEDIYDHIEDWAREQHRRESMYADI